MRPRTTLTLPAALGLALALAACGGTAAPEATPAPATVDPGPTVDAEATDAGSRAVEHAMGTTEVPADVERVVVLDTGELDAVVSLGVTPVGAVTTDVSESLVEYLEPALEDTEPVGTIGEPNLEAIAALQPDLVLSNTVRHEDLYDELSAIAPTVMAGDVGDSWKETLRLAAEALGETERAEQLLAAYESRAAEVGEDVSGGDPASVEVSVVRFLPGQVRLYTPTSFIGTVLADTGLARPAAQREGDTFVEAGQETIAAADGDVVFYAAYGDPADTDLAAVTGGPLWGGLDAVERGDVHEVPDDTWFLGIGVTAANLVLDDLEATLGAR
ncbi:ABC transporter substrate-binding protein [Aquipuribacter nitratireducens]|uniref:ABC transporter substrate-binding protein n=1 Tax=Aquipuribacter nitratireducens TaxID=650104 RepID=A0ABW0GRK5_9MICO